MDRSASHSQLILLVDDDVDALASLAEMITREGFLVKHYTCGREALREIEKEIFAVAIANQAMPGESGLQLLYQIRQIQPNCSRVLISGTEQADALIGAINADEILGLLVKPWTRGDLVRTLNSALQRYVLMWDNQKLRRESQGLNLQLAAVNERLREQLCIVDAKKLALSQVHDVLPVSCEHSLGLCFRLISTFYPLLGRQTQAVVEICRAMAASGYFTQEERHVLMTSAWIYDIGLVAIERPVLHKLFAKPETCSPDEHAMLRHHPIIGQTLAAFVDQQQAVGATVRAHHERFDGSGYPDGLAGQRIPWTARCLAVAVAFVQSGMPKSQSAAYLQEESGAGYDPEAVRLFFRTNHVSDLPRNVREVLMSELVPGMQLARGIVTPSGMLLLPEGLELNSIAIDKLNNHNRLNLVAERILVYG
jgi:response regulator RpfG family c-di-GMP phosphodiesterase